ncbi:MAG: DUF1585 domain-containing protein, partial [Proteobacteria bacterium]
MKKFFKYLCSAILLINGTTALEARSRDELRQADKVALSLTGKPLADDLRKKFLANQIELEAIAETLSKSDAFIEYYAQFWTKTIGVQSPMDAYELRTIKDNRSVHDFANDNRVGVDRLTSKNENPGFGVDGLTRWINNRKGKYPRIQIANDCEDAPRLETYSDFTNHRDDGKNGDDGSVERAAVRGLDPEGKPIAAGTQTLWNEAWRIVKGSRSFCGDNSTGTVMKVWFDPEGVRSHSRYKNAQGYRVPPWILETCGPMLKNCTLNDASGSDVYMDGVNKDMSMEAGYIIAHTVAEDKPFGEILTTSKTVMTGRYAHFMGQWFGKNLWGNYPGGSIADKDSATFAKASVLDQKHYWVERGGDLNAGLLTTPIYHAITNGRRAKANRAYETFLCRKFTVPEGAQADPSDSNPDLTKRAYCAYCHRSLEPMAAFFNRWPDTGSTNFAYDSNKAINDTGRFNGDTGTGAAALGQIMAQSDEFQDCSMKRAFEFANGRKMTEVELVNHGADYKSTLESSNMNLRTLIKKLVLSPEFL